MIALIAALGLFHLTQQRVHFRHAQSSVGPDRVVASHRRQKFILQVLYPLTLAVFPKIGKDVADQLFGIDVLQDDGNLPQYQALRATAIDFQPKTFEQLAMSGRKFHFIVRYSNTLWHEQWLSSNGSIRQRMFQALIRDPLVRRMHIYQHQALAVLRQDIDPLQLCERES